MSSEVSAHDETRDARQRRQAHRARFANPRRVRRKVVEEQARSEEHTSEFQSHSDLVCRLLLEKKKKKKNLVPLYNHPQQHLIFTLLAPFAILYDSHYRVFSSPDSPATSTNFMYPHRYT